MRNKVRLGQRVKETLVVSLDSTQEASLFVKNTLGSANKGLRLVTEALDESIYEAQEDSLIAKVSLVKAVLVAKKELIKLGMSEEEASTSLEHYSN